MRSKDKDNCNHLHKLRVEKGVTQAVCSAETGISVRTLARYENGAKVGDPENIVSLARYYNVSMDYIYLGYELRQGR